MSLMLSAQELERYARHIVLREVGGPGAGAQRARVQVVGAGGLGGRRCSSIWRPQALARLA
jgi:molybdopterin/thiamine biosynthesis adenylyltransferase